MAEQTEPITNIYALLIGIDGYTPSKSYPNLKGCVRDINLVADYLDKILHIPPERLWKLTSPNPDISLLSEVRKLDRQDMPTYENIVNAFKKITSVAQPGEIVYIHYSGHGGKAITIYPELKGQGQDDEGIVPMDVDASGGRYLRDVEIATLLKLMTDKGLVVTVVFDSCHSGGATRGDTAIRGSENRDTKTRSTDSLVASRNELISNWRTLTEEPNPSVTQGGWLAKSRDYVFLAACRPSEVAFEYNVDGTNRHGALTYWMINTLTSSSPGLTYRMLYDRINALIQSRFREQQTPMLIGDGDRVIFGSENISYQYAITVFEVIEADGKPMRVKLNAGAATGLSRGARFAIYPLGATDLSQKQAQIAIVEIEDVSASHSWAEVITTLQITGKIEQGAQAVMLSPPVDLVLGVSLVRKIEGDEEDRLPPELVAKQENALNAVKAAMEGNGWLRLVTDNQHKEDLQVAVNRKGEYELCMGLPLKNITPALSIDRDKAPQEVVKRLVHLAKYRTVQGLKNPSSDLANQLEVELIGQTTPPDGMTGLSNITLKSGEIATLRIKNRSLSPLNIVVLDLEPTWQISQLPLQRITQKFYPLAPGQEITQKLRLSLPDHTNYDKGLEAIKVFAMLGEADFRWLELPPLDKEIPTAASRGLEFSKGRNKPINALEELFAAIGADADRPPPTERAQVIFAPGEEWATKEIQITVMR